MKEFSCGAVVPGCVAVFKADSEDQILSQVARHAAEDHGMDSVPPEVVEAVRQNIVDRPG